MAPPWRSSPSPTGGPGRGPREHDSGVPAGAGAGRPGARDRRLADRRRRGRVRPRRPRPPRRCAGSGSPTATAAELAALDVPRLADLYAELGTDYELSVDVKEPAAGPGAARRRPRARARSNASGSARQTLDELVALARASPRCTSCTRRSGARSPRALERHAHDLADAGVDAINLHHTEWTAGLVALFHRFDVRAFAWDTQEVRHIRAVLAMGIDAIYCDHVDRMVATVGEWITESRRYMKPRRSRAARCGRRRGRRCRP